MELIFKILLIVGVWFVVISRIQSLFNVFRGVQISRPVKVFVVLAISLIAFAAISSMVILYNSGGWEYFVSEQARIADEVMKKDLEP